MTKRKPYKRYSAEFKKEAIRRANNCLSNLEFSNVRNCAFGFALDWWTPKIGSISSREVSDDKTEALQALQRGVQERSDTTSE